MQHAPQKILRARVLRLIEDRLCRALLDDPEVKRLYLGG